MRLLPLSGIAIVLASAVAADPFAQLQSSIEAQGGTLSRLNGAGYRISMSGVDITADRIVLAGEAVVLSSVEIREPDNAAVIQIDQLTAQSGSALGFLGGLPLCAAVPEDGEPQQLGARNIFFQSSDPDSLVVTESVAFSGLTLSYLHDAAEGCAFPDAVSFEKMQARSADGATGQIESGSASLVRTDADYAISMRMQDITSLDRRTSALVRIGAAQATLSGETQLLEGLSATSNYQALFDHLMSAQAELEMTFSGILLEDIEGSTLPGAVAGDAALQAGLTDGKILLSASSDLAGLFAGHLELGLQVVEGGTMSGLSSMLGDRPEAALADRLSFLAGRASFEDKGIVALLEGAGYSKDDILAALSRRIGPVPGAIADPIVAFFSDALDGSAAVTAAPSGPVSTAQLIMAGLMSPESMVTLLGLSRN